MENRTVFDTNNWISYFIGKKNGEDTILTSPTSFFFILKFPNFATPFQHSPLAPTPKITSFLTLRCKVTPTI